MRVQLGSGGICQDGLVVEQGLFHRVGGCRAWFSPLLCGLGQLLSLLEPQFPAVWTGPSSGSSKNWMASAVPGSLSSGDWRNTARVFKLAAKASISHVG